MTHPEDESFLQDAGKPGSVGRGQERRNDTDDGVGPARETKRVRQREGRDRELVERFVRERSLRSGAQPGAVHIHSVPRFAAEQHPLVLQVNASLGIVGNSRDNVD